MEFPFPYTPSYLGIACVWGVIEILWMCNMVRFRRGKPIGLHQMFTLVLQAKLVHIIILIFAQSNESNPSLLGFPIILTLARMLFFSVFFTAVVLASKGWGIVRATLPFSEKRILIVVVVGVLLAELFKLFYERFFMVVFVILFIVILRLVFVNLDMNVRSLQEVFIFQTATNSAPTPYVHQKLKLFYVLKLGFLVYVVVKVLLQLLTYFQDVNTDWIFGTIDEFFDLGFLGVIFITFRLQEFPQFEGFEMIEPRALAIKLPSELGYFVWETRDSRTGKRRLQFAVDERLIHLY